MKKVKAITEQKKSDAEEKQPRMNSNEPAHEIMELIA